jgi:hypothetical protein
MFALLPKGSMRPRWDHCAPVLGDNAQGVQVGARVLNLALGHSRSTVARK